MDARQLTWLLASTSLLTTAPQAAAQDASRLQNFRWEFGGYGGVIDDRPEWEIKDGLFRIEHVKVGGARAAYRFESQMFVQADFSFAPLHFRFRGIEEPVFLTELNAFFFDVTVGRNLSLTRRVALFLRAGPGLARWNPSSKDIRSGLSPEESKRRFTVGNEVDFTINGGVGFRVFLTRLLAIRADGHLRLVPSALKATQRRYAPELETTSQLLWNPSLTTGLSFFIGDSR